MNGRMYQRVGAISGLVYVVLVLLAGFLYPQQPRIDSAPATTLAWVHDHRVALQLGMIFGLFAAGVFLWFAGYLRYVLNRAEGGAESLSPIVFGSGIAIAVVSAIAALPIALLAFMDGQSGGVQDPSVVRMLGDLNQVLFAASCAVTAVFLCSLGLAMLSREVAKPWLGWASLVIAVLNGISIWIALTFSSYHGRGWTLIAFGAFLGFAAIVVVTSASLLRDRPLADS
jgi:hypothetical protein